jgi:hypothetical protein
VIPELAYKGSEFDDFTAYQLTVLEGIKARIPVPCSPHKVVLRSIILGIRKVDILTVLDKRLPFVYPGFDLLRRGESVEGSILIPQLLLTLPSIWGIYCLEVGQHIVGSGAFCGMRKGVS